MSAGEGASLLRSLAVASRNTGSAYVLLALYTYTPVYMYVCMYVCMYVYTYIYRIETLQVIENSASFQLFVRDHRTIRTYVRTNTHIIQRSILCVEKIQPSLKLFVDNHHICTTCIHTHTHVDVV
jgi:hypothetical protein